MDDSSPTVALRLPPIARCGRRAPGTALSRLLAVAGTFVLAASASASASGARPSTVRAPTAIRIPARALALARTGSGAADCGRDGVVCSRIPVPLDWSGQTPGKVSLQVEVGRAAGKPRGVMFLLAGGPGQASTRFIDIERGGFWQRLFPGYTLVTFDPRGTGDSDPIHCPTSTSASSRFDATVAACAQKLGPDREFYRTTDNVMDIEGVRRALGFRQIGLFGVSYGTDVALTYARMFPTRVRRLLLDSVATPTTALPVVSGILRRIPATVRGFCAQVCSAVTGDYARDVVSLANRLDAKPLHGRVLEPGGGRRAAHVDGARFVSLVIDSDLDPGLAAELPAAVHAALRGDPHPLLRLIDLVEPSIQTGNLDAVYTATSCDDGPFPWQPETPLDQRADLLKNAIAAVPTASLGGFGSWAEQVGNASLCLGWPVSTPPVTSPAATYPDVPVLALSGALDLRSPGFEARAVIAQFPRGHLLTATNVGHSVLTSSLSSCVSSAVQDWLNGHSVPRTCRNPRLVAPVAAFPPAGSGPAGREANPTQLLSLVTRTLGDAEAVSLMADEETFGSVAGIDAGKLTATGSDFALSGYSISGGVALSGELHARFSSSRPVSYGGVVRVRDRRGQVGDLALNSGELDGELAGRSVVTGRLSGAVPRVPARRDRRSDRLWSSWTPPSGSTAETASAIAAHVASEYRVDDAGARLVAVTAGPPRSRVTTYRRPITAIAVRTRSGADAQYHVAENTWAFAFCGSGAGCAIGPGKASETRGRLVRREALEVVLDMFRFAPAVTSVIVYLPRQPGADSFSSLALYVQKSQLSTQLARPLARTLPLAIAPLPDAPDAIEAPTIDRLTLPNLYNGIFVPLRDGSDELLLIHL